MSGNVKISNAAIDLAPDGEVVLRGVIDPSSFTSLMVADYQREALPGARANELIDAFVKGSTVTDIVLGMRGQSYSLDLDETTHILRDEVYIIDGLQRVTAAKRAMEQGHMPHLGATVYFSTSDAWEREQFHILNKERTRISPNVLIHNMAVDNQVVAMLLKLTQDRSFIMYDRVSWGQRRKAGELITASTYTKCVARVHGHLGPVQSTDIDRRMTAMDALMKVVGRTTMRDNVKTFFELIDDSWNIRDIQLRGTTHTKESFLMSLARVLDNHDVFWRENRLFVESALKKKIATFPVNDPTIVNLAGANGKSRDVLYTLMVDHINSGKRTKRLKPRVVDYLEMDDEDCDVDES